MYKIIIFIFFIGYVVDCYSYYKVNSIYCDKVIDLLKIKNINSQIKKKNYIHEYNNMNKNSYRNVFYEVKPGDTLFYIAWITGNNYLDLARNNNIKKVNVLKIGQILQVKYNTNVISFFPIEWYKKNILVCFYQCYFEIKRIVIFFVRQFSVIGISNNISSDMNVIKNINDFLDQDNLKKVLMQWSWPTLGNVINTFSDTEGGNKGIDIVGVFDQPILASMNGKVVYVGNVLQGYGNLIVIQHENDYLSAYAHNNKVLVMEKQIVRSGDQIATMGNSGTHETKLHFEIRYKGKSIDPLCLLPKICLH